MMWLFWCLIVIILLAGLIFFIVPIRNERFIKKASVFLVLPIAAILLYFVWGDSRGLSAYYQAKNQSEQVEAFLQQHQDPQEIIIELENRLHESGDSTGWYLLGRLYSSIQNFDEAAYAFDRANRLDPNNSQIMVQYALTLYFAHENTLNGKAQQLLEQLLAREPNQPDALNLLAVDAYQREDYETAIVYWRQLLTMFSADQQAQQALMTSITQAQNALENENGTQALQMIKLDVQVDLSEALRSRVSPDQTVFVYARAEGGPHMPLSIVRRKVADLPFEVTLDDSTSMMTALNLSDFTRVIIYARVAQRGQAETEPGDLIGTSDIMNPSGSKIPIEIKIDRVVD